MKNRFSTKSRPAMRLLAVTVICSMLPWGAAWGKGGVAAPVLTPPLSQIPVPVPRTNAELAQPQFAALAQFVTDVPSAIKLGKALFWDMQAGSDGVTACASCHYFSGADPLINTKNLLAKRDRNQLHPGANGAGKGLNYLLTPTDFPFVQVSPVDGRLGIDPATLLPLDPFVQVTRNFDDVTGSQGIRLAGFNGFVLGQALENSTPITDNTNPFNVANVRQVTGRNTPPAVNAVFNYANFWDGRANNIFNGVNPIGPLDVNAGIWVESGGVLVKEKIAIPNASLASQATGPPLSEVEMSFRGRTFPELGRKMLVLTPLAGQLVDPLDSVLGAPLSKAPAKGLNTRYDQMVKNAFVNTLWNSGQRATLPATINGVSATDNFTQMEANFSLFWGLSIMLYEATLVSDRTPFDQFLSGNENVLTPAAQNGFNTFGIGDGTGKCDVCHAGPEFTTAVVGSNVPFANPVVFTNNTTHKLILAGLTAGGGLVDTGFFNIGVRPTAENAGRGAAEPDFPFPLSFSRLAELAALGQLPFVTPKLPPFVPPTTPDAVQGSFKVPGLRNVELTPPYFHNGSARTLDEVVEFYTRGGNFPNNLVTLNDNPNVAIAVQPLGKLRANPASRTEVVEFLKSLTDERVRQEKAPFDHPELQIPNGVDLNGDIMISLPATGGAIPVVPLNVLTLAPVTTPTVLTSQVIGGMVDSDATVAVSVNNGAPAFATVPCTIDAATGACALTPPPTSTWNFTATGLALGINNITITAANLTGGTRTAITAIQVLPTATISGTPQNVTRQTIASLMVGGVGVDTYQFTVDGGALNGVDLPAGPPPVGSPIVLGGLTDGTHTVTVIGKNTALNLQQPVANATTAIWTVKANPPLLTIDPVATPAKGPVLKIGGVVELGLIPVVRADTAVTVGPVTNFSGVWSCQVSGLKSGVTNFTVTATDIALNVTSKTVAATIVVPDGNLKGTGSADITDAIKALRIAVGLDAPSSNEMLRGDVAPLVNDVPAPDGRIDVADALVILRKVVGLVNF
jgi:cytochrome c peroxidase